MATSVYCPLVCSPDETDQQGIMHDVLRAAFKDSDYTLSFAYIPYGRIIEDTLAGKYTGATFAGEANSPDFFFVDCFTMINRVHFAVPKGSNWSYTGPQSLKTVRLGIPTGFRTSNKEIDAYIEANKLDPMRIMLASGATPAAAQKENLQRLLAGRLDVMLVGSLSFSRIAHEMDATDRIRLAPTPIAEFHNHIAFSPKAPDVKKLRTFVQQRVLEMIASGELAAILKNYEPEFIPSASAPHNTHLTN